MSFPGPFPDFSTSVAEAAMTIRMGSPSKVTPLYCFRAFSASLLRSQTTSAVPRDRPDLPKYQSNLIILPYFFSISGAPKQDLPLLSFRKQKWLDHGILDLEQLDITLLSIWYQNSGLLQSPEAEIARVFRQSCNEVFLHQFQGNFEKALYSYGQYSYVLCKFSLHYN